MASANQAPTAIDYALQLAAGAAAILALSFGGDPSASNRTGLYAALTPSAEQLAMVVGGQTGPIYTRSGTDVNVAISGALSLTKQFTSTVATGTAPFVVASTTNVANLNASSLSGATFASPGSIGSTTPGSGKFSSVTNTGLTVSGGVVFASAAGLTQVSAGLTYSTNVLAVGDQTAVSVIQLNGAAGNSRNLTFRTGTSNRWLFNVTGTAESGGNAGSNFAIQAYDDSGVQIDTPLTINRASGGAIAFTRPLQPGSGSASAPSFSFSNESSSGWFRAASGAIALAISGVERYRLFGNGFIQSFNSVAIGTSPITSLSSITIHGSDAGGAGIAFCTYGANGNISFRRANGTAAALTALAANDIIGSITALGYEGTTPGFTGGKQLYRIAAAEAFTSTAQGIYHDWYVVNTGTTATVFAARLSASGNLLIGTATDGMTAGGSLAVAKDLAHRGTKAGLFNATPVVQPATTGTATGFTAGAGTGVTDQSTFTGGTGTSAYRISDIVLALKQLGAMAA